MKPSNGNVAVVARLYEARGNLEVIRQVLAPDVRWEVSRRSFPTATFISDSAAYPISSRVCSLIFEIGTQGRRNFRNRGPRDRHWHILSEG
jgi:hypothetical protein